jgi:cobalt-precorrin-5B (C1)-methyltransferase
VSLRTGITTGTCAAAAARAAATVLAGLAPPPEVPVELPDGRTIVVRVLQCIRHTPCAAADGTRRVPDTLAATAAVRKDAGDDPDVTDGLEIVATVSWTDGSEVTFSAGEGVGTVTKPGLQVPPGQPAINPVPRRMIAAAVRQVTPRGLHVEIAIPGGRAIAAKTFNPRLGIVNGLSVLGTSGIVRPYCTRALHDALRCAVDVAAACGQTAPVLVPGAIGARAARARFALGDQQLIEVGNAWGFVLDLLPRHPWRALMLVGHPGKLAKLAAGQWDTHSSRSDPATALLVEVLEQHVDRDVTSPTRKRGSETWELSHEFPSLALRASVALLLRRAITPTTEGIFAALDDRQRNALGSALAGRVRQAVVDRLGGRLPVAVLLVGMSGQTLGCDGDVSPWR